jgi:hypothetical protein
MTYGTIFLVHTFSLQSPHEQESHLLAIVLPQGEALGLVLVLYKG